MDKKHTHKSLLAAFQSKNWAAAKAIVDKGVDPDFQQGALLASIEDNYEDKVRFALDDLGCSTNTKGANLLVHRLMLNNEYVSLGLFKKHGFDFNVNYLGNSNDNSLLAEAVENNISIDMLKFLKELDIDFSIGQQKALKTTLQRAKFTHAQFLLENGGTFNPLNHKFLRQCLLEFTDDSNLSIGQLERIAYFMLKHNTSVIPKNDPQILDDLMERAQRCQRTMMIYRILRVHLSQKLDNKYDWPADIKPAKTLKEWRQPIDINGVNLPALFHAARSDTFKNVILSIRKEGVLLDKEDLMQEDDQKLRVIDYLASRDSLRMTFNEKYWLGKEDQALDMLCDLPAVLRDEPLITRLKINRLKQQFR